MTRSKVILLWFAAVTLVVVGWIALGAAVTVATGVMLLGLSLVPAAIVYALWPGEPSATAADVFRGPGRTR
jgi:hypothetical protein